MRVLTYNVNSLTQRLSRVEAALGELAPDVVCLQETKSAPEAFPHLSLQAAGYTAVDHSRGRWAGVAILARDGLAIDEVRTGLPGEPSPDQARWVQAEIDGTVVASVYVPNGQRVGSEAFAEKLVFFEAMRDHMAAMADRDVLVAGDMNVCLADVDAWDPEALHGGTHATPAERERFQAILDTGYVDAYRHLEPEEPGYTWWDYRAGHFHKGFGLRIDLVLASAPLRDRLRAAAPIREWRKPTRVPGTKPSDHTVLLVDLDR